MSVPPRRASPALLQVDAILTRLTGAPAVTEVCRFLRAEFAHYGWVGVYALDGATLRLVGWDGDRPTEHTTIPVAEGLCGRAARENTTILVGDVREHPEYLSCFLETRSEAVVPIRGADGRVLGEIDIDGSALNAYDASDGRFLEEVAGRLARSLGTAPPAGGGAGPS